MTSKTDGSAPLGSAHFGYSGPGSCPLFPPFCPYSLCPGSALSDPCPGNTELRREICQKFRFLSEIPEIPCIGEAGGI